MSVGNDVVDLEDPETRLCGLHPRFAERVFTDRERGALDAVRAADRHLLHWTLWAAKESAFKALKRLAPETAFSPKDFEVTLSDWTPVPPRHAPGAPAARLATGCVRHRAGGFTLEVRREGAALHAVAWSRATDRPREELDRASGDPSVAVRRLAIRAIAAGLGLEAPGVRICGRPPILTDGGRILPVVLSLSHHGRFAGFAFRA